MELEQELLRILEEAEDVASGRLAPIQNTFDNIRKLFTESEVADLI